MLAPALVDRLICPKSRQSLIYFPRGESDADPASAFLLSPGARLRYRIDANVPVLLVEEATSVEPSEVQRLVARAHELKLATK
jgi:uncharacterized protein YbaR (Trm112 family)